MSNLVSIIIPYFNSSKTLHRLLTSILNQVYDDFECILIDDGSSDDSFSIVNNLIDSKPNFFNFNRPEHYKSGGRGAKNYGFTLSKGDYIVFFDSDDRMNSDFLKVRVDYLNTFSEKHAVITNYFWRVKDSSSIKRVFEFNDKCLNDFTELVKTDYFWLNYMDYRFYYPPGNPMYRRSFIEDKQMWNETTSIGEDHEYHARLFLQGLNLGFVNGSTFDYVFNETSMIATSENPAALLSRSYGKMLVVNSLITYNCISSKLISKEIICQIKILRRIVICNSNKYVLKCATNLMLMRITYLYNLLNTNKLIIKFNLNVLKFINLINEKYSRGYILYTILFKDISPTSENTFFVIYEKN